MYLNEYILLVFHFTIGIAAAITTLYVYDKYQEKINLGLKYYFVAILISFLFCLIFPFNMKGEWNWFVITGTSVAWCLMQFLKKMAQDRNK